MEDDNEKEIFRAEEVVDIKEIRKKRMEARSSPYQFLHLLILKIKPKIFFKLQI